MIDPLPDRMSAHPCSMINDDTAYLVFETGGTKLVAGVAGADRRIVETIVLRRGEHDTAETSLSRLIQAGHQLRDKHEAAGRGFAAVGFGFGGVVRRSAREAYRCLHESGWEEIRVAERIEQEFGLPVAVENDCKLAALAEAHFGAGRGARTVFYITIGTGVGGFPVGECAGVMIKTVMDFLKEDDTRIEKIYFVLFDEPTLRVFEKELSRVKDG